MSYETTPIWQWNWDDWKEFYIYLEPVLENVNEPWFKSGWGLVNPPDGDAFLGFWWYPRKWTDRVYNNTHVIYLQIQQGEFCFRVGVEGSEDNDERGEIRLECSVIVKERLRRNGRPEIIAPPRHTGVGHTMAFARVEREDWLGRDYEFINKELVLERLHAYEDILEECFPRTSC
jgi:hypothetical protein